ncbi:hypothetical protein F2P81_017900 [Scophthalmus maximus]|uniref:Peptidase M14 domain-containing protein n=1 Tax=Scophthalmus maximus TaxID=52904 RepID=A0A6A4S908_SCOMX|nr:hypothetical protein F2P81_017900 [Scophthalmus maximus]
MYNCMSSAKKHCDITATSWFQGHTAVMSSLLFFLLLLLLLSPASSALEFRYHNNREIEQYLVQVNASNPDIAHLYSIGQSVRAVSGTATSNWQLATGNWQLAGKTKEEFAILAMRDHDSLEKKTIDSVRLIDDLVRGYRDNDTRSLRLLSGARLHVLPTMNPDGFDEASTHCQFSQGRFNYNGVDLNRNFPDAFAGLRRQQQLDEEKREAEVRAVIGWLKTETFVLSANLHGGALVASYPYDNSNGGSEQVGGASVAPDDDVFIHLAKVYSHSHGSMHRGDGCDDGGSFVEGITNGYQWYPLAGVKGRVFDGSGSPVQNAVVEVKGRKNMCPFRTDRHGEYFRLLLPGNYSFTVTYPGHEVLTETLDVPHGPDRYSAMTHDFLLLRTPENSTQAPPTKVTPTPTCNYTLSQEAAGGAIATTRPTWAVLSVGLGFVAALRSVAD